MKPCLWRKTFLPTLRLNPKPEDAAPRVPYRDCGAAVAITRGCMAALASMCAGALLANISGTPYNTGTLVQFASQCGCRDTQVANAGYLPQYTLEQDLGASMRALQVRPGNRGRSTFQKPWRSPRHAHKSPARGALQSVPQHGRSFASQPTCRFVSIRMARSICREVQCVWLLLSFVGMSEFNG